MINSGLTAGQPPVNRGSTAGFVSAFGLQRVSLVCASGETFRRHIFDALEVTFTKKLATGDLDVAVDKLGEVHKLVDSKTRTYHGRLRSGRTAEAGRGRSGLNANRTVRLGDKASPVPFKASQTRRVIEHKRCPTGKISQQQNQSQNRPVQNANTSHAAEACRQRAWRRAG